MMIPRRRPLKTTAIFSYWRHQPQNSSNRPQSSVPEYSCRGDKTTEKRKSHKKHISKFTEGWVEFERKSVAKKVAAALNNTQVSTRKKSKHYDCIWNIKYLSNFKWTHLHERLAYEKAARRQRLRAEIQLAKKKTNFFTLNLGKKKKSKQNGEDRTEFLSSLNH